MSPRSPAATAAGAAALVLVCGVASYVGASLARGPDSGGPAAPGTSSTIGTRLDELERDRDAMKERLRRSEELLQATLDQVTDLRGRLDAAGMAAKGPAPPTEAAKPRDPDLIDPEGALSPEERAQLIGARLQEQARKNAPVHVKFLFGLWADATAEGTAARKAQAIAEARSLAMQVGFTEDSETDLREAFIAYHEQCARDLGPAVRDTERPDLATVEAVHPKIWTALDERLRTLLGDTKFRIWSEQAEATRKITLDVYAEERKKR